MKYFILTFSLLILSCGKDSVCPGSVGNITKFERSMAPFSKISILGDVEVVLTQGNPDAMVLECGENLADHIITEIVEDELIVNNRLKCNWLRDLDTPIILHITKGDIREIYHAGQRNISTSNTFNLQELYFTVEYSNSRIELDLNCNRLHLVQNASNARIQVDGFCDDFYAYNDGNGSILAKDFFCEEGFITNHGTGRIETSVQGILKAHVYDRGNIYYAPSPDSLLIKVFHPGTGEVIPL